MRIGIVLLLALCLASGQALAQRIMVRKLGENVLVMHEPDWEQVNMVVVATDDGLVIFDTLSSPDDARKAKEQIPIFLDQPVRAVVNTNSQWDHIFGNQAFPEATFFGHADCAGDLDLRARETYETFGEQIPGFEGYIATKDGLTQEQIATLRREVAKLTRMRTTYDETTFALVRPDSLLEGGETLVFGDTTFEILRFGPLHTTCDLVVFDSRDSLLLTTDIFYQNLLPAIDKKIGATLSGWIEMLTTLVSYADRVVRIVPSHGTKFYTFKDLERRLAYLHDLREGIAKAHENGWNLGTAMEQIEIPGYESFSYSARTTQRNIEACWEEMGP